MYLLHLSQLQISYNLLNYIRYKPLCLITICVVSDGFSIYLFIIIFKEAGILKDKTEYEFELKKLFDRIKLD